MPKIPDRAENQRRFAALPRDERRLIVRAVNRGEPVAQRRYASLTIGVARRQQRFWRYAWLLAPVVGLIQLTFTEAELALTNTAASAAALIGISWFWHRRARRAEEANLALLAQGSGRTEGHRPGRSRSKPGASGTDGTSNGATSRESPGRTAATDGPRPKRPRGRKRR